MIFEKIENFQIDIEKLRAHLWNQVVNASDPVMQGPAFGGWSVLSSQGSVEDGWQQGHLCFKEVDGKMVWDEELAKSLGFVPEYEHKNPTPICTGYLAEIMKKIYQMKFNPRRARISILKPKSQTDLHMDAKPGNYAVRLHIPIVTNEKALFCTQDEGDVHLPADGSAYLLRVDRLHQAVNFGDLDRYHLIMQVWDVGQNSKFHQYQISPDEAQK